MYRSVRQKGKGRQEEEAAEVVKIRKKGEEGGRRRCGGERGWVGKGGKGGKEKGKGGGGPWPGKIYWAAKGGGRKGKKENKKKSHFCLAFAWLSETQRRRRKRGCN